MMAPNITDRPRNAGEVLKELVRISSRDYDFRPEANPGGNTMTDKTPILFLSADPTDVSRLRLGQELREIQEKLQLAKMRDKFSLVQRLSARPVDISQAILDEKPRIVHFSGHGASNGGLCFENEVGESKLVQPDALAALFELVSNEVDCVLLNACYSEAQANAIAKHISWVIGMSEVIGDNAAISFAVGFYQALGAGKSIEEAYKFGRVQIRLQGIPEHLTPVLLSKYK
jgi:CHAT domain